jgi:chitin disaccharide deacetylase
MTQRLVLHADDLGMSRSVSDGILYGFRHGLLTSTSLLANAPDAERALEAWKALCQEHAVGELPSMPARERLGDPQQPFDLGVHLNLTQGRPLLGSRYPAELLDADGRFRGVFGLFARLRHGGDRYRAAIGEELQRQVQLVYDNGVVPTHLNGHQYIEMIPAIGPLVLDLAERFGVTSVRVPWEQSLLRTTVSTGRYLSRWPLAWVKHAFARRFRRLVAARGIAHPDVFFGTAHAGSVDLTLLQMFLRAGQRYRLVEIGLHPGETPAEPSSEQQADGWHDPLAAARPRELQMLVSVVLPQLLEQFGWKLGRLPR